MPYNKVKNYTHLFIKKKKKKNLHPHLELLPISDNLCPEHQ